MTPLDRWLTERTARKNAEALRLASKERKLRRFEEGLRAERIYPARHSGWVEPKTPGPDVALLTVANDKFFRGLEALILSLLDCYPELDSPFYIIHDGSLIGYLQRRLLSIYRHLIFEEPKPSWLGLDNGTSANQRRIGALGYLNTMGLTLRGYTRVIILDSDIIIEGGIDPLWAKGESIRAVADCGDTAYAVVSSKTGRPVLNSGVLSIPGSLLNEKSEKEMESLILGRNNPYCPLLDSFADQKVWNQFISDKPLELLPINFNCNIKYISRYLDSCYEGISVIHFAGEKPWLMNPWVQCKDKQPNTRTSAGVTNHELWNRRYRELLYKYYNKRLADQGSLSVNASLDYVMVLDPSQMRRMHRRGELIGKSIHLVITEDRFLEGGIQDDDLAIIKWLSTLCAEVNSVSELTVWLDWEWKHLLRNTDAIYNSEVRYLVIDEYLSADFDQGIDMLDDSVSGLTPYGFTNESQRLACCLFILRQISKNLEKKSESKK